MVLKKMDHLKRTLAQLVSRAKIAQGISQQAELNTGLNIDVNIRNGEVHLRLWQWKKFPSIADYYLVLDFWPEVVGRPVPKVAIQGNWKCLEASWRS